MRLFRRIGTAVAADWIDRRQRGRLRLVPSCTVFRLGPLLRSGVLAALGGLFLSAAVPGQEKSTVTVSADAESIEEGETASFTLTRTAPHEAALTVMIGVDASDRTVSPSRIGRATVDFAAGDETASYSVSTIENNAFQEEPGSTEVSQSVSLEVLAESLVDPTYMVGDLRRATVMVTDNDERVEFSLVVPEGGFRIAENAGTVELSVRATTVTAGSPTDNVYGVILTTETTASAASGVDYDPLSENFFLGSLQAWSSITVEGEPRYTTTVTYSLEVYDDAVDEGDETFELQLQHPPGRERTPFGVGSAIVTILDDDTAGVTVEPTELTVTEGDSTGASYTVVLESRPTANVTMSVTAPPGAGVSVDETSLTFTDADWDEPQTVTVTAVQDADRVGGTVTLAHSAAGGGYDAVSVAGVEVTVVDDDAQVSVAAASAVEGAAVEFPVTMTGAAPSDIVLGWSTSAGTATSGSDYTAVTSGSLTIEAGDTSGTLTVSTTEDTLTEADETFTVTITGTTLPTGTVLGVATATGTIEDDDTLDAVVTGAASAPEGSMVTFTVSLTGGASTAAVVVTYVVEGTATPGEDYTAPSGILTIAPGDNEGAITIATKSDDVLEGDETLILTLTSIRTAMGKASASVPTATTTLVEGTSPSGPVATGSVRAVGTPVVGATLTAVLSNVTDPDGVGEFRFRWIAGDAEVPDETDETCLLREEELGNMMRVEVAYTDDLGKVKTLVSDPVGPVRAAPTPPPETPPTLTISPGPSPVVEGSAVEFTVRRSHAKTDLGALEVTISETGSMLTGVPPRAFRFAVGETTARLRLDTDNDEVNEAGSEVRATLAAGADYELGTPRAATVLVLDDDASPGLIVEPGTASEDAGMVELVARLTAPAGESLSVAWSTSDATAMAGVDYVESSGMLTFPVGATEERFSVGLIDDRIAEGNEYLLIMLRDAWTEVDESPIAVTILDDDPASANVELTLDRERVSEGEGPVALTVTAALDRSARGVDTAVEVALSGSGASGTVGYTAAEDFVLTIPEGALSGAVVVSLRRTRGRPW